MLEKIKKLIRWLLRKETDEEAAERQSYHGI